MGEIEITGTQRIAVLPWQSGSDLLTFGVEPVGIDDANTVVELLTSDSS
jgi:ABC-type Fe3+-citrate transport system substrate-binding protein